MCSTDTRRRRPVGSPPDRTDSWAACNQTCDGVLASRNYPEHIADTEPRWDDNGSADKTSPPCQQVRRSTSALVPARQTEPASADHTEQDSARERSDGCFDNPPSRKPTPEPSRFGRISTSCHASLWQLGFVAQRSIYRPALSAEFGDSAFPANSAQSADFLDLAALPQSR